MRTELEIYQDRVNKVLRTWAEHIAWIDMALKAEADHADVMSKSGRDEPYPDGIPCFKRSKEKKEPLLGAAPTNCQLYSCHVSGEDTPIYSCLTLTLTLTLTLIGGYSHLQLSHGGCPGSACGRF